MIGRLQGTLLEKSSFNVLLDVGGVGYELEVPSSTLSCLPALGTEVILYTHLVVREDAHLLYAFTQKLERDLFRDLLRLNGVGPKLALALISVGLEALVHAVQQQSTKALMSIPGVGKKTAERLLVELKDRLKGWEMNLSAAGLPLLSGQPLPMGNTGVAATAEADAISALQALGFKPQEAIKAVRAVYAPSLSAEDLIRLALKGMHS